MAQTRLLLCFVLLLVPGCGPSQQQLKSRASYDFRCPENQLQVVKIDSRTRGVQGCGQQATYVKSCDGTCTWILNTDSRPR